MYLSKTIKDELKKDEIAYSRFLVVRKHLHNLISSNYDITNKCNLECIGCLYFDGKDSEGHHDSVSLEGWADFFQKEKDRGVNFPYFAGAEPSMVPERLQLAAKYFDRGVVFTNGAIKISEALPFKIHISVWDTPEKEQLIRGKSFFLKALENYQNDPRAVFVFTINSQNINEIEQVIKLCENYNVKLTFSIYSPTTEYLQTLLKNPNQINYTPTKEDLQHIRTQLDTYIEQYPNTIIYTKEYNKWVTNPQGLYSIENFTRVATNCEIMKQNYNIHYRTDLTSENAKCCSPNIDCEDCRAYAMAYGTALGRYKEFLADIDSLKQWLSIADGWIQLFLEKN